MNKELLNIVKELSEKPTTELALQFMELTADNIIKDKEIYRLNNIINEAINYIDDNTYYRDHKGYINIDDLYIILQKGSDKE